MSRFVIHIPVIDIEKTVEVEVKVNGQRRRVNYRVELFDWPKMDNHEERIDMLRSIIKGYNDGWELFQIGPPDGEKVPVVFKKPLA